MQLLCSRCGNPWVFVWEEDEEGWCVVSRFQGVLAGCGCWDYEDDE